MLTGRLWFGKREGGEDVTLTNLETVQRAIGIIEGISFACGEKEKDALTLAVDLLDSVMDNILVEDLAKADSK